MDEVGERRHAGLSGDVEPTARIVPLLAHREKG
jgi:hypothetical protein